MSSKKSEVWDYFTKRANNAAVCNLCGKIYKMGGGTTNLKNHLFHKHSSLSAKLQKMCPSTSGKLKKPTEKPAIVEDVQSDTDTDTDALTMSSMDKVKSHTLHIYLFVI